MDTHIVNTHINEWSNLLISGVHKYGIFEQRYWEMYWEQLCKKGVTFLFLKDLIYFSTFVRFIVYIFRKNVTTAFLIAAIVCAGSSVWYKMLVYVVHGYHEIITSGPEYCYKGLGVDYTLRILPIVEYRHKYFVFDRWTNPVGLLINVIRYSCLDAGVYIDPLSLFISHMIKNKWPGFETAKSWFYYYHMRLGPNVISTIAIIWKELSADVYYWFFVRVLRTKTPYFIRWHWTQVMGLKVINFYTNLFVGRIVSYGLRIEDEIIEAEQAVSLIPPDAFLKFQFKFLYGLLFGFIFVHISILLFGFFHAILGQYFYALVLTDTTELHVGSRPDNDIYNDGGIAWQYKDERKFGKFWYGLFGRGTSTKLWIVKLIEVILVNPIYRTIKRILRLWRRIFKGNKRNKRNK